MDLVFWKFWGILSKGIEPQEVNNVARDNIRQSDDPCIVEVVNLNHVTVTGDPYRSTIEKNVLKISVQCKARMWNYFDLITVKFVAQTYIWYFISTQFYKRFMVVVPSADHITKKQSSFGYVCWHEVLQLIQHDDFWVPKQSQNKANSRLKSKKIQKKWMMHWTKDKKFKSENYKESP